MKIIEGSQSYNAKAKKVKKPTLTKLGFDPHFQVDDRKDALGKILDLGLKISWNMISTDKTGNAIWCLWSKDDNEETETSSDALMQQMKGDGLVYVICNTKVKDPRAYKRILLSHAGKKLLYIGDGTPQFNAKELREILAPACKKSGYRKTVDKMVEWNLLLSDGRLGPDVSNVDLVKNLFNGDLKHFCLSIGLIFPEEQLNKSLINHQIDIICRQHTPDEITEMVEKSWGNKTKFSSPISSENARLQQYIKTTLTEQVATLKALESKIKGWAP